MPVDTRRADSVSAQNNLLSGELANISSPNSLLNSSPGQQNEITSYAALQNAEITSRANGTENDDVIKGTANADEIHGRGGNDTIHGYGGDDVLYGDEGDDYVRGYDGNDYVLGGFGNDRLEGLNGHDDLDGGAGNDYLKGGYGMDLLYGGVGHDILYGESDNDSLYANEGDDSLFGGSGDDLMFGGAGHDFLSGDTGIDHMYGDEGNDVLRGGNDTDVLYAGAGTDRLYGDSGNDVLFASTLGKSYLSGGTGADVFAFTGVSDTASWIRDFNGNDKINIYSVLEGFDPLADAIEDFVRMIYRDETRSDMKVNVDGAGGDFETLAFIEANLHGVSAQDLLDSGRLIVDQSAYPFA